MDEKSDAAKGGKPDDVTETGLESFPASDAPAWTQEPRDASRGGSAWDATATLPRHEPLTAEAAADVCVIGAGYAGLTAAYRLLKGGRSVIVLDSADVGRGESGATTAHHTALLDRRWSALERIHGAKACAIAAAAHLRAVDDLEAIVAEEGIDCDFERVDGYLFLAPGGSIDDIKAEAAAATRCGIPGVELVERVPLDGFYTGPALRAPRQAQSHPHKYLAGLAGAVERRGGRIHGGTHVESVRDGSPVTVRLRGGPVITAEAVIVAANVPMNDRVAMHTRQAPYRSYAIASRLPAGAVPRALYWDTADPYHYARLQRLPAAGEEILIVGGEDHKTGQADDAGTRYARLERWARERFPRMGPVEYRWSGQVVEPVDGLAYIGRNPGDRNVYVVTGHSGNGTTYGTLGARLLVSLIDGEDSPAAGVFTPARHRAGGAVGWMKENLNAAARYADYVTPGEISSADELKPGEGAVLRRGLAKVAAYRDQDGVLCEFSAVCPHLGGIVRWNSAEKSWDCPVHGSRFGTDGRVLNGPAAAGLSAVPGPGRHPRRPREEKPPVPAARTADKPLVGVRVAILVADGFEEVELTGPREAFDRAGAATRIVSPADGEVQGFRRLDKGAALPVDVPLSRARPEDFDALLLPGGVAGPDGLRVDPRAVAFVRSFVAEGKPIAAICHGPWTLIEAGGVVGRTVTSWPSLRTDLANAGARWVDEEVVVDDALVTSRRPDDLPAFVARAIEAFAGVKAPRPRGRDGRRH